MLVYRTDTEVKAKTGEKLEDDGWKRLSPFGVESSRSIILTDVSDDEHDQIINVKDGLDPLGLRGFMVKLHINERDVGDPDMINLVAIPARDQIIRHQDRYYLVRAVLQSSNFGIAAYVKKITDKEFRAVTDLPSWKAWLCSGKPEITY